MRVRQVRVGAMAGALIAVFVAACGSVPAGSPAEVGASPTVLAPATGATDAQPAADRAAERLRLLRTCPAEAPSWSDDLDDPFPEGLAGEVEQRRRSGLPGDLAYVEALHRRYEQDVADDPSVADGGKGWASPEVYGWLMTEAEERQLIRTQNQVDDAVPIVDRFLRDLPDDQAGQLRVDAVHNSVIIQVTRDAEDVRLRLQKIVGDKAVIVVELVRWSLAELKRAQDEILGMDDLRAVGISAGGGDDRVEVGILGDAGRARTRLAALFDPCMVKVSSVGPGPHPIGLAGLRGREVDGVNCPSMDQMQEAPEPVAVSGDVRTLVVCSFDGDQVRVSRDDDVFPSLVTQLERRSEDAGGGGCTLMLELKPPIFALTDNSTWELETPTDGCNYTFPEFRTIRDQLF